MKAVKFYGVGDVRTVDTQMVIPEKNQALIQIYYGGICGSDLHIYREGMFVERLEETIGHEFVGRISSAPVGSGLNEGDLVVGDPRVPCQRCQACLEGDSHRCASLGFIGEVRPGCFAQYLALDPEKLIVLPSDTDLKQAALSEPLAVAVHACKSIIQVNPKCVLVVGAGPIGLLITYLLKNQHKVAQVTVADMDKFRRERAAFAGADQAVADISVTGGKFDCAVDAVGVQGALQSAIRATRPGGSIFISAIYEKLPVVDINYLVSNEQKIYGNNAYSFVDLQEAARLIGEKRLVLDWLVTSVLPADQADQAFRLLTAGEKTALKILLDFQS